MNHQKGVYIDGHERDDVVAYRKVFVDKLNDTDRRCMYKDHSPNLNPGELPLVTIQNDELTFFANADQDFYWMPFYILFWANQ